MRAKRKTTVCLKRYCIDDSFIWKIRERPEWEDDSLGSNVGYGNIQKGIDSLLEKEDDSIAEGGRRHTALLERERGRQLEREDDSSD